MSADALTRITRRHRYATLRDVGFAVVLAGLLAFGVAQLVVPLSS